jgi:DhnA family fructose-bisphosphate aldolase class Ia
MNGIQYRLDDFIPPHDRRSLVVDASAGLALGALPGLEDFRLGVGPLLPLIDGLVCSPGQLPRLAQRTRGEAGLLVRMDWSNTWRAKDFVLPPAQTQRIPILTAQDACDLGAVGMVGSFLLGYEEEVEAGCLHATVQWAMQGKALGIPLVIEIQADGPRVSLPGKAVELAASYALEGGADVIVVPYPGSESLAAIAEFVSVPWLLKPTSLKAASAQLEEALALGAAGLWLDYHLFAQPDPTATVGGLRLLVHAGQPSTEEAK